MDVTGSTFQGLLPSILHFIASAEYVAFDLELSGIPSHKYRGHGKQTLQERYAETKKAAEHYHVLQLGLTCIEEDKERGVYVLRPYNFYLNPLPDKGLGLERDFTFSSGAVNYLLDYGFHMDGPIQDGVPFLSREEEALVRQNADRKRNINNIAILDIKKIDLESQLFVEEVREIIISWKQSSQSAEYLNIGPASHSSSTSTHGLNGFQRRLVHQLVRSEFQDLVSVTRQGFVQILPYDREREDAESQKREERLDNKLRAQIGLRWIAEALCPNVNELLPEKHVPPVLVGHNVFLDLIYFYTCFFGSLPDRVEDFQLVMGRLFPLIFDTKYLADIIQDNSTSYNSSLAELDRELSMDTRPLIELAAGHEKYAYESLVHEAGFDSFLTAKVFIRLSARVAEDEGYNTSPEEEVYATPPEYHGVPPLPETEKAGPSASSYHNSYELLGNLDIDDDDDDDNDHDNDDDNGNKHGPGTLMMPPSDSPFWSKYGDKLRVNGTVEGVCPII